ncbi:hypothetical protein [Proteiniclasticum sp. QWL-01]|uniref:hypothetical protein n=1 Tax=Proteiniclasticum sp. QWL-01 TaxID=3036945 RepID=UPI00220D5FB2|nr:hypothetical protein [Proteiniclasticum sp. QWL-01]UUM12433.1 hypothetical protein NQU17_02400 [Clostridiaceae bacterium HFYG-1003]WFF73990.1 hypothetical protein P6M73_05955 [Proteiniclasticum sp. QWL-01]
MTVTINTLDGKETRLEGEAAESVITLLDWPGSTQHWIKVKSGEVMRWIAVDSICTVSISE